MLDDTTPFVFTPALLSHPFMKRTVVWHGGRHETATVGRVRRYIKDHLRNIEHLERQGTQFDYRSFYHALKWELERLEAEAKR